MAQSLRHGRRLLYPTELIDRNASRLKRDLRRLHRQYRVGLANKLECHVQGDRLIRQSEVNMQFSVQTYVERRGLRYEGDSSGITEALNEGLLRWRRTVEDFEHHIVNSAFDGCLDVGACTCSEHLSLALKADVAAYWSSPAGLTRRIDGLSQDMNFRIVNNSMKMIAPTNNAQWLRWVTAGDDHVCPDCIRASQGGKNGYYMISWFSPQMPIHGGDRCLWELLFYTPFPD